MTAMIDRSLASGIRDNRSRGSVGDFLRKHVAAGSDLAIVSAYFTIYAYDALRESLDGISHLRFLFGEPRFLSHLDPQTADRKAYVIENAGLKLAKTLSLKRAAIDCARWLQDKADIRSIRQAGFLHGKLYHVSNGPVASAILGSSNFTVRGLGLSEENNNIELNLEVDSTRDRLDLMSWFDELWEDTSLVTDVKSEVLEYLTKVGADQSPEFIYFKTLYHLFEGFLADQQRGGLLDEDLRLPDTQIWKSLYEFQRDGVRAAINKILRHNGCILADSVGLGKTYEALAVIKYFELRNERVLVLCPKKLRNNWEIYPAYAGSALNPFLRDRFDYTLLCHTDLSRYEGPSGVVGDLSTFNWGNFNLVVIDESHNFRNDARGKVDESGRVIRKSRYERLMSDIIKAGVKTKVLLLSATPVNNDLRDLRNQIYILTGRDDAAYQETMGVQSVQQTLKVAQSQFTTWSKMPRANRQTKALLERLDSSFFKLLDELTIARSRKHILSFYPETIEDLGGFPVREKPQSIYVTEIDTEREFPTYDELFKQISNFRLSLYNPSRFVKEAFKPEYEKRIGNFTQEGRERILISMMRVGFLKRLESSVVSFTVTIARTIQKIDDLVQKIAVFRKYHQENPMLDLASLDPDAVDDEELAQALEVGKQITFRLGHLKLDEWLEALDADRKQLWQIQSAAAIVNATRDAKLADLKDLIAAKVRSPSVTKDGRTNRKVLVFTAFSDTASYIYEQLSGWAQNDLQVHIALVTGGDHRKTTFGESRFEHILTNFSPIAKRRSEQSLMPQVGEIDILIATDCISEGQNLQDCDLLVNYDIHWNPVRIIQRFGRIDRIGSRAKSVRLVNFWPTEHLDRYISLKNRVETRMALVDITATGDDALLENEELTEVIEAELDFRDKQLMRLKEEVLDLEDLQESVSLTDFSLEDFRVELLRFLESNRELFRDAPMGLYAIAPAKPGVQSPPGVIFCLRQRAAVRADAAKLNPLQPYFLVYVTRKGDVRFTFAQPKQILELYRRLCAGVTQPDRELVSAFEASTSGGAEMGIIDDLLRTTVASIVSTFQRRVAHGVQHSQQFVIPRLSELPQDEGEFELVTWLVLSES